MSTFRFALTFSTDVSKRLVAQLFLVPCALVPMPMALSALTGVIVWLLQRSPRLRASSLESSVTIADTSTCRPGRSNCPISWTIDAMYSGGAVTMSAFCRHTGTMRTWEIRLELFRLSVGGRARCHQNESVSPVVVVVPSCPVVVVGELWSCVC